MTTYSLKRLMALFFLFPLLLCNNSDNEGNCGSPSIHSCSGDPCVFFHVYDDLGYFVAEGNNSVSTATSFHALWNGMDCRGDSLPCGRYDVEMHYFIGGISQTSHEYLLIAGPNSTSAQGRTACDSLKAACSGKYAEVTGAYISGGSLTTGPQCLCCE